MHDSHAEQQHRHSFEAVVAEQLNALGMKHSIGSAQKVHTPGPVVDRRVSPLPSAALPAQLLAGLEI